MTHHYIRRAILFVLVGLSLSSCHFSGGNNQLAVLQYADSLMENHPDSALLLLENIDNTDTLLRADRAYYALLLTQAKDKNYIKHTTDSVMHKVVDYYDSGNNDILRMKAHYYLARVYQDMDSVSASVGEFLIALQLAEGVKDSDFICLSAANLGHFLKEHDLPDEADSYYQRAEEVALSKKDSLYWAFILINRASIAIQKGKDYYEEAEQKLLKAFEYSESNNNMSVKRAATNSLLFLYSNMERYDDAIQLGREYIYTQPDSIKKIDAYLILGDAFYHLNQNDSANFYLKKSLLSPNYHTKYWAYNLLSNMAAEKGLLFQSLQWKDSCLVYDNLASTLSYPVKTIKSLERMINQRYLIQYKSLAKWQWFAISFIVTILLLSLIYFVYKRQKYRKRLIQLNEERSSMKELFNNKLVEIQRLHELIGQCEGDKAKIYVLDRQLKTVYAERDNLLDKLIHALPVFKSLTLMIERNKDEKGSKERIDIKLWGKIISELDDVTNNFTIRLSDQFPMLKKDDIHFCCLLKMGFKYSDIACLCGRTINMMYKRRDLVIERTELDASSSLETFIKAY